MLASRWGGELAVIQRFNLASETRRRMPCSMWFIVVLLGSAVPLFSACSSNGPSQGRQPAGESTRSLEDRLSLLEKKVEQDEFTHQLDNDKSIIIKPASDGYTFAQTDVGPLTFQIATVAPLADGSQVRLKIGNPTSATISRLTARVAWGTSDTHGSCLPDANSTKNAEWQNIPAASWHSVTVAIPALPPTKLGCLVLDNISVASMELYTR